MVAAWISADTGVGPSIASKQPRLQRHLRRFATGAEQQQQAQDQRRGIAHARHALVDVDEGRRSEGSEHDHDGDGHAHVTDPVDHERLLGRSCGHRLVLPEADQQVRGQAHTLPADEEHQVVVGQHQQQHRGDEEVEEGEEAAPALVMGHVADGVDVDQAADAGDQQHEDDRELVDQQPDVDLPDPAGDPVVQRHRDSPSRLLPAQQIDEVVETDRERG